MSIELGRLSNGIRVVTQFRDLTGAVAFHIYFGCGGRHEPDSIVGVSHALEHMMFKGTPTRSHLDIARQMEGVGALINASTDVERTCYHFTAPEETFEQVLEVYADAINNSLLDSGEWEKERRVILEELKMYEDTPRIWVSDRLETTMYNLQVGVIGDRQTIQAIQTDHMRELMAAWYCPANTVVSVAGRVSHDRVMEGSERLFGSRAEGQTKPSVPALPSASREKVCGLVRQTDQVNLAFGFRACGLNDADLPALRVLNDILGGKMSSRLFSEVREKRGLAYSVHSSVRPFTDEGFIELKAGVALEKAVGATRLILQEAARLKEEAVTEQELVEAKRHLRGSRLVQEDSDYFAGRNGTSYLLRGRVYTLEQELEDLERVSAEQVKGAARSHFRADNLTASYIAEKDLTGPLHAALAV